MAKNNLGREEMNSPIYGFGKRYFTVGDLEHSYGKEPVAALNAITIATTSAALSVNARGISLEVHFGDILTSCDIQVFRVDPGPVDTLVWTFTGLTWNNIDSLFVGPYSGNGVDFKGFPVKVRAQNFAGGGNVTVYVKAVA